MGLAIKSITITVILAGLLAIASCVSAEQKTQPDTAVSKVLLSQVKQPGKVRVTVCGKEILSELEGKLEPLRKMGVVIEKDADGSIRTRDLLGVAFVPLTRPRPSDG